MAAIGALHTHINTQYASYIQFIIQDRNELTLIVAPHQLLDLAHALKTDAKTQFDMLVDVCGIDYLHYGLDEWQTLSATETGFSRGSDWFGESITETPLIVNDVSSDADLHFTPLSTAEKQASTTAKILEESKLAIAEKDKSTRFAVVYHLLSLQHNHRIRLRVPLENETQLILNSVIEIWPAANWFEREVFDLYGIIFRGHPDLRRLLTDYGFRGHPFRKDFPLTGQVEVRYDAELKRVIYQPVTITPRVLEPKVIRKDNRYAAETPGDPHGK